MELKNKGGWVLEVFSLARKHRIKLKVDELFLHEYNIYQADFLIKERNQDFEEDLCRKKDFSFSVHEQDKDNWKIRMFNRSSLL